jgi:hypothetical protein
LDPGDVQEGVSALYNNADTVHDSWFDPLIHGTPDERQAAFNQGFSGNMDNCVAVGRTAYGPSATVGDFRVDVTSGVTYQTLSNGQVRLTFQGSQGTVDLLPYRNLTGNASYDPGGVEGNYFGQGEQSLGSIVSFIVTGADGSQQTVPLPSLVGPNDSIAAIHYDWNYQGQNYYGMFILVEESGIGGLAINAYTQGDSSSIYYSLANVTLDGLE